MEDGSFFGLGFTGSASAADGGSSDAARAAAAALMQQCLAYHDSQQEQRRQDAIFVPARTSSMKDPPQPDDASSPVAAPSTLEHEKDIVEAGKARAAAILAKFQKQQEDLILQHHNAIQTPEPTQEVNSSLNLHPSVYAEQRRLCLVKEEERKYQAVLKNFDYVSRQANAKLRALDREIRQSRESLSQALSWQQQQIKSLKGRSQPITSPVDTKIQQLKSSSSARASKTGVALYVSGFGDGITSAKTTVDETYLRQLLGGYGNIQKVHLYRHKESGAFKGDALVVFQTPLGGHLHAVEETLVATVCGQMHGAELPCGSILSVEPAQSSASSKQYGAGSRTTAAAAPAATAHVTSYNQGTLTVGKTGSDEKGNDEDDDLDDFFDSL